MSDLRFIIEMGMGNEDHGRDYTSAAKKAVLDALHGARLEMLHTLPQVRNELRVKVTIGVQEPTNVDVEALKKLVPTGDATVHVKKGGLNAGDVIVAQAAIEAFLPFQG